MALVHLHRPGMLGLLVLVVPLALFWWLGCRRAAIASRALVGGSARGNALRGALRLGALAAVLGGLASPALLDAGALRSASVPVVFLIDVSASMEATDVPPSRLERAQGAVRDICALLPAARTALVATAGDAAVVCPPTTDREAFFNLLGQSRTDWFIDRGSRPRPALGETVELLSAEGQGPGAIILVSDGEFHAAPQPGDLRRLVGGGAVLHTVTVGSEGGALLPAAPGRPAVMTRARPDRMRRLAEQGGGRHWRVGPAQVSLPRRREDILPPRVTGSAARRSGKGLRLAPALYVLAALLLAAERLLPPGRLSGRERRQDAVST